MPSSRAGAASDMPVPSVVGVWVSGLPDQRFDLVVVAAGFTEARLPVFVESVGHIRRELLATPPLRTLRRLLNVWRVDRVGDDLGAAYDPDSERVLTVDVARARAVAEACGTRPDALLAVVDSPHYAGSGLPGVAVVTSHPDAARLALHELGHAAFDLADEYGGPGPAASGAGEPRRVNVSREPDPTKVKWADLVTPDGQVGCFEGGDRTDHGIYRPTATCLMRSVGQQFCPICRRQISATLLASLAGRPEPTRPGFG